MRRRTWLALLVALATAVAACGGDEASDDPPAEPSSDGDADGQQEGSDEQDADADQQDDGSGSESDLSSAADVAALLERGASAAFHVQYETDDPAGGQLLRAVSQDPPRFSWWESDAVDEQERTFALHNIQESADAVIGCIWVGENDSDDVDEWECARHEPEDGEATLFDTFFGALLFDAEDYPLPRVAEEGWEHSRDDEVADREVICGTSPAFAEQVEEVCVDAELGIPLSVERDGASGTAVEVRSPEDDDFEPPNEPWDGDADD